MREEPVYELLGGPVRDELVFYATGPRPDLAKQMGFVGGKMALQHGPAEGEEGLRANVERIARMRERVGEDFWLMYDCWMALDLPYALRLIEALRPYDLRWLEEALAPEDYWGCAELKRRAPATTLIATGEHEHGLLGFRMLLEMDCCHIVQPDVNWCGGMTELVKISALAEAHGALVELGERGVPAGSPAVGYPARRSRLDDLRLSRERRELTRPPRVRRWIGSLETNEPSEAIATAASRSDDASPFERSRSREAPRRPDLSP